MKRRIRIYYEDSKDDCKESIVTWYLFFAIIMLFITANTECAFIYHENEKPQSLYKYKGIRNVKKILHENSTKTIR